MYKEMIPAHVFHGRRAVNSSQTEERQALDSSDGGLVAPGILIHARGMNVDQQLREAVHRKVGRVRRYAPKAVRARVFFEKESRGRAGDRFRTAVLFEVPGNDLIARHTALDPLTALDFVSEKIERRLRRRKTALLASRVRDLRKQPDRKRTGLSSNVTGRSYDSPGIRGRTSVAVR